MRANCDQQGMYSNPRHISITYLVLRDRPFDPLSDQGEQKKVRKGDLVDVIQVISPGAVDADGGGGASISNTTVPTLRNIFCRYYKPYSTSLV